MAKEQKDQQEQTASPEVQLLVSQMQELSGKLQKSEQERSALEAAIRSQSEGDKHSKLKDQADFSKALAEAEKQLGGSSEGDDDAIDRLSNRKLMEVVGDTFETSVAAQMELLKKERQQEQQVLAAKLDQLSNAIVQVMVKSEASSVMSKFKDFGEYGKQVAEAMQRHPTMSMEDAYIFAKATAAKDTPPRHIAETERPEAGPRERPRDVKDGGAEKTAGIVNFRQRLREAAARAAKSKQGE